MQLVPLRRGAPREGRARVAAAREDERHGGGCTAVECSRPIALESAWFLLGKVPGSVSTLEPGK
jgi:hypothetical protein